MRTAARKLGWTAKEAIGKTIKKGANGTIKAVIKDFHFSSLHDPIGPLLIFLDTGFVHKLFVRVTGKDIPVTLKSLQNIWKQRVSYRPFEYHFLEEEYNNLYVTEQKTARVFTFFAIIAILLACLGLFGLAAFTSMQRRKEIGIRKVLGASLGGITLLLSLDFLKLVFIAIVLAIPAGWYFMYKWLLDFSYRIEIQWWVFVMAGIAALLIALITVGFQAVKAGLSNPVKSLRSE